ncbi:MAG: hypothetical protein ACPH5Z_05405 [Flavobacteriaceae bacterium]
MTTLQRNAIANPAIGLVVFNRLYDADLLSKTEWKKRLEEIKEPPPCELAALAHLHLRNVDRISGIFLQQLQPEITLKKVMSLRVKNVCVRRLTDELRMDIDQKMEQLSPKSLRRLLGRPRRVHLITELYFGQLKLYLEKEYAVELETVKNRKKLPLSLFNEGDYINEYDFDNYSVPFAYRMEPLYKFNG